ncbi:MAG: ATP-binding cassette domain-containing protein, partial [Burkholderiales bacterium]
MQMPRHGSPGAKSPLECGPNIDQLPVPPDPIVEFSQVDFSYDATPLLRAVNLRLEPGKVIAIMGGSGSGKTTL